MPVNAINNLPRLIKTNGNNIKNISKFSACATAPLLAMQANDVFDRSKLEDVSELSNLNGPEEVKRAKKVVKVCALLNTGIAGFTAKSAIISSIALAGVETYMINTILNEIYGMDLKKSMSEALERALYASICGTSLTRNVSNLFLGKIPLFGNAYCAAIGGAITKKFGDNVIKYAEKIEKENYYAKSREEQEKLILETIKEIKEKYLKNTEEVK